MHFSGAHPELACQRKKKHVRIGQVRSMGTGRQRIIKIPGKVIQGLRPAVSLVLDKAEQHAERMGFRSVRTVEIKLEKRQQGRGVRKLGPLDQEARHLDLWMRTRLQ